MQIFYILHVRVKHFHSLLFTLKSEEDLDSISIYMLCSLNKQSVLEDFCIDLPLKYRLNVWENFLKHIIIHILKKPTV